MVGVAVVVTAVVVAAVTAVVAVDGAVAVEAVGEVAEEVAALEALETLETLEVLEVLEVGALEVLELFKVVALVADAVGSVDAEVVVEAVDFVGAVVSNRSQPTARKHRSETARMMLMSWTKIRVGLNGVKRDMISTSFPECRRPGTGLAR